MKPKTVGVGVVLLSALAWSAEPIIARLAYVNAEVLQTVAIRAFFVMLTGLVYTLITNRSDLHITKKETGILLYVALAAGLLADTLFFIALKKTVVVNAVLLTHSQIIFIILLGLLVLKRDVLIYRDFIGIVLMIVAAVLVTAKTLSNLVSLRFGTLGDVLVLIAAVLWATTAIAVRKYLPHKNAGTVTFYRFLFANVVFMGYLFVTSDLFIVNIYQVLTGIVGGIGYILYYEGLKRLKAAQAGSLELTSVIFAAIMAYFILGESVSLLQGCGAILLFIGVYFISRRETIPETPA